MGFLINLQNAQVLVSSRSLHKFTQEKEWTNILEK